MYFPPFSYSFPFFSFFFFFLCCAACFLLFYFLRHVLRCLVSFNRWWPDSKETTPNNPLALVLSIPRDHCVLLLFDSSSVWRVAKRKKNNKNKDKTTENNPTRLYIHTLFHFHSLSPLYHSFSLSSISLSLSLSLSDLTESAQESDRATGPARFRRSREQTEAAQQQKFPNHEGKNDQKKNNKKKETKIQILQCERFRKTLAIKRKDTRTVTLIILFIYKIKNSLVETIKIRLLMAATVWY